MILHTLVVVGTGGLLTPVLKLLNCFAPVFVLGLLELGGVVVKESKSENLASNPEVLGGDMLTLLLELTGCIPLPRYAISETKDF